MGFEGFIASDELINSSNGYLHNNNNNALKLHFTIDLTKSEEQNANLINKMFDAKHFCDFAFIVKGKEFKVNKAVLSVQSKVFKAMFANDMIEKHDNQCIIEDIECDVFKEFLSFIYRGKSSKMESMAEPLLIIADKYEILDLKDICEDSIFSDITTENAIQIVLFADKYNASKLLHKTIDFIVDNISLISNLSDRIETNYC